jgi:hypothetical protein
MRLTAHLQDSVPELLFSRNIEWLVTWCCVARLIRPCGIGRLILGAFGP